MKKLPNKPPKVLYSLLWVILISFSFVACKDDVKYSNKEYDPTKPVVLTSFSPKEGGAKDKILLDGENFGNDPKKIKVYFNKKKRKRVGFATIGNTRLACV